MWWAALSLSGTAGQSLVPFTQGLRPQALQRREPGLQTSVDGRRIGGSWGTSLLPAELFQKECS